MTMNNIYSKLRSKNIKNYYMLIFCIILSIVLVASYAVMFFSSTVQEILPIGGDSMKQAYLIFGIAIVGCALFTTYASSIFFKYKNRETGILLSLGAKKSQIKKVLFIELSLIGFVSSLIGLTLSIPVSFGIWKLFQIFIIDIKEMVYKIGWPGLIYGIIFCILIIISIFIMGLKFINRTNIIDILNEHRKCEIVKDIKSWYGVVGSILIIVGMLLGYAIPQISIRYLNFRMPAIWNITFLLSAIGMYMLITYIIVYNKKGKNLKKYYKNIIPKSMMKFMGKQTVKNMCTISFLISGALFAAFYTPLNVSNLFYSLDNNPVDYSFHYKESENQIKKNEIYLLAQKHNVNITSYYEVPSISLIVNGINANFMDNGKITYTHIDKIGYSEFFSESDFNKISKQNVDVKPGEYLTIITPESLESIHERFNDLNKITNPVTNVSQKINYAGTITFQPFVKQGTTKYVISDEDYKKYAKNLPIENFENFVLFNVKNPDKTYAFANDLKNEIIKRSSKAVAVSKFYDDYEKKLALEKGEKYYYESINLSSDNNLLFQDWKYYPSFNVLDRQDIIKNMSVFLMLFIYIAIICFTAVAIIAYTRSITIAINNKTLFNDLKNLGANNKYIEKCIKVQLKKIFTIPTVVGSTSIYLLFFFIVYGNSGSISPGEYAGLRINFLIMIVTGFFMYLVYRLSLRKIKKIIQI
ncbi:FtsX-like permease family protein [Clostridium aciditolerans]|uniref:FtsX-like permease family protein n=1 Tax=Clostridium aciditolerans TaxID=339861 RepID=A0A934M3Q9_9CLOT|nr:FtsX-like permease family protein [Clostridium aciditolerans]MBI6873300.1 FtsX-like permease family protein [Clostridium aciditolerans]